MHLFPTKIHSEFFKMVANHIAQRLTRAISTQTITNFISFKFSKTNRQITFIFGQDGAEWEFLVRMHSWVPCPKMPLLGSTIVNIMTKLSKETTGKFKLNMMTKRKRKNLHRVVSPKKM